MTDKPLWDQLAEIGASQPEAWESLERVTIERETLQQALEALEASLPAHHFRDMPRRGKSLAAISTLRAALAAPAAEPTGFDRTTALVLLSAASKSGDPGAISLAAQLAGAAPCKDCGFVNFKCRCAAPPAPAAVPLTDEQILQIAEPFGAFQYGDAQGHVRIEFARAVLASGEKT